MIKTNYHTHSLYCDGSNTLEEMVLSAIDKGFSILGFSGHSMYPYSSSWHIPVNKISEYVNEVNGLKDKYKNKITILCGFEADYIKGLTSPNKELYKKFKIN